MLIFCIVLTFALIFMIFDIYIYIYIYICCIDDKNLHLKRFTCMKSAKFLILNFLQGSAATCLRCGGQPNMEFVGNLLVFAVVKEFCKSIKN